jgi:FKBP-type peptidyl-prolyl cis-trans isomerase FklB
LLDGKEFDSSFKRNQPFTAPLRSLIKGWQIAIPLMNEGSHWRLWIPSDLAYGDRGAGGDIPGGATLIFEVELLKIL